MPTYNVGSFIPPGVPLMADKAQIDKAGAFRRMHERSRIVVLPNAWDVASARMF